MDVPGDCAGSAVFQLAAGIGRRVISDFVLLFRAGHPAAGRAVGAVSDGVAGLYLDAALVAHFLQ